VKAQSKHLITGCLALGALATTLTGAKTALADIPVSIDVNYANALLVDDATHGWGGQLRFGPRLDLKILTLDSEIVAGGVAFYDANGADAAQSFHGLLGPRLGILWGIRPSVYSHLGIGHTNFINANNQTSLAGDLGVALDITFLPVIDIGGQAAWNFVAGDASSPQTQYLTVGLHITFFANKDD
jgi:hypothetical protein